MRIEEDSKLDYKDVLIRPKRSTLGSRKDVELEREFTFRNYRSDNDEHYRGIPIMASNMDGVGTFEMADALAALGLFTCLVKNYDVAELIDFFSNGHEPRRANVAYSTGITEQDFDKFKGVYDKTGRNLKYVCVDVANGYSERFSEFIKQLRDAYPHIVIIAGNVVTGEMTEELILSGADIVKVGIGPGSVCTTRIQTGVGFPQLSAVIECADAAHGLGGHIIADGGCTCPGDLAGWEDLVEERKFVNFYGMSSKAANEKHFGGLKEYRSSEGREIQVPYRGRIENTIQDLLGGVRSTCTYAGAKKLKWLSKCTTFVKTSEQFNSVFAEK
jgi:GMP reductase